jgi:anti-anti-sigma regulatory factor
MSAADAIRIPLQLSRGRVLASIQVEIALPILERFRQDLLHFVSTHEAKSVILDLAGVEVMDLDEFNYLKGTLEMVAVLGARPILAGLQPGMVAALVEMGVESSGILAARNVDRAVDQLESLESSTAQENDPSDDLDSDSTAEGIIDVDASPLENEGLF